ISVRIRPRHEDAVVAAGEGRLPVDDALLLPAGAEVEIGGLLNDSRIPNPRDVREAGCVLGPGDEIAVSDRRMDARRRRGSVLRPTIQGEQERPGEGFVVRRAGSGLPVARVGGELAGTVLGPPE